MSTPVEDEVHTGATPNERLIAAARDDNLDLLLDVFDQGGFDINYKGLFGNTALHYAAKHGSIDTLEYILSHDDCDVDPLNTHGESPLQLAITSEIIDVFEVKKEVVESLLEAGADIKKKGGGTVSDLLDERNKMDAEILVLLRKAQVEASISRDDIAYDDDDDDDDGSAGSASDDE